ncbi:MAG: ACP S-malonyltransferase, partial [Candidatus Marinimicrobia bacterium]|nr:ACP S-malonyltransferase [Candidatus Neomarinimicrobiota bacterium]
GETVAVKYAMEAAKTAGAKKALEQAVSGAFHSPLMEGAKEALQRVLRTAEFKPAKVPVYCNVDAQPTTDPEQLKENLVKQLDSPVLWEDSVARMVADGAGEFVEIGPGRVLQGLVRRINRDVTVRGLGSLEDLEGITA